MDIIKLFLIGGGGGSAVGKTCILHQYTDNTFYSYNLSTIGIDFKKKEITLDDKKLTLIIWDTDGRETTRTTTNKYLKNSNIVLIVYDITNRRSFKELNYWIQTVKKVLDKEEVIISVAANKYDLIEKQEVSKEEGEQFAKENNCLFYETSAKVHDTVKRVFEGLLRAYLEQIEKKKKENKIKEYKNGDKYEGNLINDLKEGTGIMKYNNGDEYSGDWKNDLREGNGILKIKNGNEFEGEWINDIFIKGKIKYINGEIYNGEYKNNKREGKGTMKYNNGDIYEGNWDNNMKNGYGEYIDLSKNEEYNGNWINDKKEGKGILKFKDGYYEGEWKNDLKNGNGKIKYNNENIFEGNFINGNKEGEGKIIIKNKGYLKLIFKNNISDGNGIFYYNNENILKGYFDNNYNPINGLLTYINGDTFAGEFNENGKRNGYGIMKYDNGDIYDGNWKNDNLIKGKIKFNNKYIYIGETNVMEKEGKEKMKNNYGDEYEVNWLLMKKMKILNIIKIGKIIIYFMKK